MAPASMKEIGVAPFAPATVMPNVAKNPPPTIPPTPIDKAPTRPMPPAFPLSSFMA
jgi:hypothetical protein